jgi:hypothetical protein
MRLSLAIHQMRNYIAFLGLQESLGAAYRRINSEYASILRIDEGRKRVIGIIAAILASLHMQTADDLFGGPRAVLARTS